MNQPDVIPADQIKNALDLALAEVFKTALGISPVENKNPTPITGLPTRPCGGLLRFQSKMKSTRGRGLLLSSEIMTLQKWSQRYLDFQLEATPEENFLPEIDAADAICEILNMSSGVFLRDLENVGLKGYYPSPPIYLEGRFLGEPPTDCQLYSYQVGHDTALFGYLTFPL